MQRKLVILITTATFLLLLLGACQGQSESQIEQDINYLCSEACFGRLVGTAGNEAARDYILSAFEAVGLEPLDGQNSLLAPYEQMVFDPAGQHQTLTAEFPDGSVKTFQGGADFYPYSSLAGGFSGAVSAGQNERTGEPCLFVQDGDRTITVVRSDRASPRIMEATDSHFNCTSKVYDQIEGCEALYLDAGLTAELKSVDNIAGVIPGKTGTTALLITAHFDHVGGYGDIFYPGAYDNASGTALLLETLRQMKTEEFETDYDIVFIAFNGEEGGLNGSRNVIAELNYDTVNVVNLDCVGLAGSDTLAVAGMDSPFRDDLVSALSEGVSCVPYEEDYSSDHLSFEPAGIPAVSLTNNLKWDEITANTHFVSDKPDKLDTEFIAQIASCLCQYGKEAVLTPHFIMEIENDVQPVEERTNWALVYECAEQAIESKNPPYGYCLIIEVDGRGYSTWDISYLINPDRAEELIPSLRFPHTLGDFQLDTTRPLWIYSLANEFDLDGDDRRVSIRAIEANEAYEVGQLQEKGYYEQTNSWEVYYRNETLEFPLFACDGEGFNADELRDVPSDERIVERSVNGGTIYELYRTLPSGEEMLYKVVFAGEGLPYYYELSTYINSPEYAVDASLMDEAVPYLLDIPRIP